MILLQREEPIITALVYIVCGIVWLGALMDTQCLLHSNWVFSLFRKCDFSVSGDSVPTLNSFLTYAI